DEPAVATDSSGVPSAIERSPLDFADEAEASDRETAAPEMPSPEEVPLATVPGVGQAVEAVVAEPPAVRESRKRGPDGVDANAPPKSSPGIVVAEDPGSKNASSPIEVGSPGSVYRPEWGVTNGSLLDTPEACQDLVDHAAPSGYFTELRHMPNDEFLRQYNDPRSGVGDKNLEVLLETEAEMKRAAEGKNAELMRELEDIRAQFSGLKVSNEHLSQRVAALQEQVSEEEKLKAAFEEFKRYEDDRVEQRVCEARCASGCLKHRF
nr:hypothetical protein [Tanacetum cinerariifolium]